MRPIRVLLAVSAAALVAACGSDSSPAAVPAARSGSASASSASSASSAAGTDITSLSGEEILAKAKTAFTAAKSVHVVGDGTSGQGAATFKIDMRYGAAGTAVGTITNAGQTIELRRIGQTLYLKASEAFWTSTSGAAAGKQFGGKYVKAPVTDQHVAGIVQLTDKAAFFQAALSTTGGVTKGAVRTLNGTRAIPLTTKDSTGGGTLFIAASGEPLPLEVLPVAGSKDSGRVDFTDYGAPVDAAVPPPSQTVDIPA